MMKRCSLAALAAAATALGVTGARAHEFSCEKTVNGRVVHRIDHYPARLRYEVTVTNTHPTSPSTAIAVEDKVLESLGFQFAPVPFTLDVGQKLTKKFEVVVKDREACLKLAQSQACGGSFDDVLSVVSDVGETQCRARVVCGEEKRKCAADDDECDKRGCDDDEDSEKDDDDKEHEKCGDRRGDKHGLGFWKSHERAVEACVAAGPIDLGIALITSKEEAEGILWGNPAWFGSGCNARRSSLDQKRFLVARELLVATCNERVLGAKIRAGAVEKALGLVKGRDCRKLQKHHVKFEHGRDCACQPGFDEGPATSKHAESIAVDATRDSGESCDKNDGQQDDDKGGCGEDDD